MAIVTARLLLRQWRDDDLPAYAALNADLRVREFFLLPSRAPKATKKQHGHANIWK
jgi:RimJ/RimL family protein N-acetyltransferase